MNKILHISLQKCIATIVFFKVLLQAPFSTGMICPSSPFLTKALAYQMPDSLINLLQAQHLQELEQIRLKKEHKIDEKVFNLSGKTQDNSIIQNDTHTSQHIKNFAPTERQATERQAYVVELGAGTGAVTKALLARGVPPSRLIVFEQAESMASLLRQRFPGLRIIQDDAAKMKKYIPSDGYIAFMVSSLPFVSLPLSVSENIISAIKENLEGNHLIQYTYALNQKTLLEEKGFAINKKETVWLNLPPAHVLDYSFQKNA